MHWAAIDSRIVVRIVWIRVLGSLTANVGGQVADLGGPRQRAVLALLLVARAEVVSVDRLIDDLWRGEPPPRAIGALQAYISNLRRALEPERPPRTPASVLISAAPGYALRLPAAGVDAWRFEQLLRQAGTEPERARSLLEEALALWRGPAYAEVADEPWARPEAARLLELRSTARERLAGALLDTGAAAEAVPLAEQLTQEQPLREEGWRLLTLALYAVGRQGDALTALRRARALLADELGLDPGAALLQLESDILAQRVQVRPAARARSLRLAVPRPARAPDPAPEDAAQVFIGRRAELATVHAAAAAAARGSIQVLLVAGEAGAGKSALLDRARVELTEQGWRSAVGRCPEAAGAPPAWPWVEVVRGLAATEDPGPFRAELAPLLQDDAIVAGDATSGRFRLHRAVAGWLAAGSAPLLLVLDDLHRADAETLANLRSVVDVWAGRPDPVRLLLAAAYRQDEVSDQVAETLADLARNSPTRIRLAGLEQAEAARLVQQVSGLRPGPEILRALAERTAGNPFYLRESARLLASEGELVATSEVPEGVRDVLRRRLARLPVRDVAILRLAAVIGRDVEVDLLIAAAEVAEEAVIEALEAGVVAGLLTEPGPGTVRFAHVLIQETLLGDLPRLRRARWHARVATALESRRPHEYAALAHHYAAAESASTARLAVDASVTAAELASSRYAHDTAARLYRRALDCLDLVPVAQRPVGDEERSALYCRLVPALLWSGNAAAAEAALQEGLDLAERSHRPDLAIAVLRTADLPLPWLTRRYGELNPDKVAALRRALASPDLDPLTRSQLLCVLVREQGADDAYAVRPEALEAVELARGLHDATQLGSALGVLAGIVIAEYEPDLKRAIVEEMLELCRHHDLPGTLVLAHQILMQLAMVTGDFPELSRQVALASALAERYQVVQVMDTCLLVRAAIEHRAGRLDDAERLYLLGTESIKAHGSLDGDGLQMLALCTVRMTAGRLAEMVPVAERMFRDFGPVAADIYALVLLAADRPDEARRAYQAGGWPRADFFQVLRTTVRGMAAVGLGMVEDAAAIRDRLLPFADQVAGSGTGAFLLGPVAEVLGDLALLLGRPDQAHEHYRQALELCRRIDAPLWAARAQASLAAVVTA